MNLHFKDKKVFICSGDTDLGAACVIEFLNENAQVNTTALSIKKIKRLFKKFNGDISHKNLKIHEADITNFNDINLLEDQIKKSEVLITHTPSPASEDFIQWNEKDWLNFFDVEIDQLVKNNQLVFLDITADWCATCQFNKLNVLNSKTVIQLFKDNKVTLVRADWTKPNSNINLFLEKYDRFGIPFNAFFSNKFPEGYLLSELLSEKEIVNIINNINNE